MFFMFSHNLFCCDIASSFFFAIYNYVFFFTCTIIFPNTLAVICFSCRQQMNDERLWTLETSINKSDSVYMDLYVHSILTVLELPAVTCRMKDSLDRRVSFLWLWRFQSSEF